MSTDTKDPRPVTPAEFLQMETWQRLGLLLRWLRDNPDKHDQGNWGVVLTPEKGERVPEGWECGTQGCAAGHATWFAGAEPVWERTDPCLVNNEWFIQYDTNEVLINGDPGSVRGLADYARELLGFSHQEAEAVFFSPDLTTLRLAALHHTYTGRCLRERDPGWENR